MSRITTPSLPTRTKSFSTFYKNSANSSTNSKSSSSLTKEKNSGTFINFWNNSKMPLLSMTPKQTPRENIILLLITSMQGVGCVKDLTTALKTADQPKPKEFKNSATNKSKSSWVPKPSAEVSISEQFLWSSTTQQPKTVNNTVRARTFTEWVEQEGTRMRVLPWHLSMMRYSSR